MTKKKKIILIGVAVCAAALIIAVIVLMPMMKIISGPQELSGDQEPIPKEKAKTFSELTKSATDWTSWLGTEGHE